MYRSPRTASTGGASGFLMFIFLLWGALYVSGCADASSGTGLDLPTENDPLEMELAVNDDLSSLLVDDVVNTLGPDLTSAASLEIDAAQSLFASARASDRSGDPKGAIRHGAEARIALARALLAGGDRPLREYTGRTRQLRDRLASGATTDEFNRPNDVLSSLSSAVTAIESALARGDGLGAAQSAVRVNQEVDRDRAHRPERDRGPIAELWVRMAHEAVDIAGRLLEGTEPSDRQIHALESAGRMAESASEALAAGQVSRAFALSHRAVALSLMAVVLPEVTVEDAAAIEAFAQAELEAAWARDLSEFETKVLGRAQAIFEVGVERIRTGDLRGVNLVWRAGVAAAVIAN